MSKNMERKTLVHLFAGPAVFFLMLFLPESLMAFKARAAIGTVLWMILWWVWRPVNIAVTALLPIAVNACLGLSPMEGIISQYFSEIVVLLLGADMLTSSWSATGLDKRLSLSMLCLIGPSVRQQVVVWFTVSVLLSAILPNVVVCSILASIAASMLTFVNERQLKRGSAGVPILLAITWGAGIGGCGSPLGGAMNLVSVNYLEALTGREFMYVTWVLRLLPFLAAMFAAILFVLFKGTQRGAQLAGSREYFRQERKALPPMSCSEAISLGLFLAATIFSFCRPLFADALPGLKPAYVFLVLGVVSFVVRDNQMRPISDWNKAEKEIMWGMFLLFAGGLAVGKLLTDTGATDQLAKMITVLPLKGGIETIIVIVAFVCLLTEVSSNTAAAAIAVPVVCVIVQHLGLNPIPYVYIASAAFNSAYMLPISIRAIPVGLGLDPSLMAHEGAKCTLLCAGCIIILGWALLTFWPGFSAA